MRFLIIFFILSIPMILSGQYGAEVLKGRQVDPNRYAGVKNSPFLFEDWKVVSIIPSSGTPIEGVLINFNGHTQNFESLIDGKVVEIELGFFIGMKIIDPDTFCGGQSFLKFQHPRLTNPYPLFAFNGRKYRLIKDFRATLVENKVETPGKTEKFESFSVIATYYLMTYGELEVIRLTEKDIMQKVKNREAEAYVKSSGLDLTTEAGLCQLLTWLDTK